MTWRLYHTPSSPYVRKVLVCAHELGVADRIEFLDCAVHPINRDMTVVAANPLGKIPTLLLQDGTALYDSRVICEFLDAERKGGLFPAEPQARWRALREQARADGLLDAAFIARHEVGLRPAEVQWPMWRTSYLAKVMSCVDVIETEAAGYGDRVDIGTLTMAVALGYLDFRFAEIPWRPGRPQAAEWFARISQRDSMRMTFPAERAPVRAAAPAAAR